MERKDIVPFIKRRSAKRDGDQQRKFMMEEEKSETSSESESFY